MRPSLVFASVAFASFAGVLACSSESSSSPGSSSSSSSSSSSGSGSAATVTSEQCSSRCQTKMTSCDAPANIVSQGCGQLCGNTLTEAQLSCFEGKSCQDIEKAESFDALCPAGSSSSSSSSSGSSGSSGNGSLPTKLTVSGTFPATKAIHVKDNTTIASNINVSATPSFSPSQPSELPDVTKAGSITIKSPSQGGCKANITFTLNGTQAAVTIIGSDTLPATDCATFTDAVANQGILAELADVPYPNASTTATVTFDLEP